MKHLAIVMDGNRRWAKKNQLQALRGHQKGSESIQTAIEVCLQEKIPYLSLYTFSLENFKRSEYELSYLFELIQRESIAQLPLFQEHNIKVRFIGDRSRFPASVIPSIETLETTTANNTALTVNFLFCYGGRQEIAAAARAVAQKVAAGVLLPEQITESILAEHMWMSDSPDPDLIIRTGGAHRLSNFLLYQAAYSELYFLDCFWPDITQELIKGALETYRTAQRNFGV